MKRDRRLLMRRRGGALFRSGIDVGAESGLVPGNNVVAFCAMAHQGSRIQSSTFPVLNAQAGYTLKLSHIVSYKRERSRQSLPGNQDIVGPDRCSRRSELRAHLTGATSVFRIELKYFELQRFDAPEVVGGMPAFMSAEIELMSDDRRHGEISRLVLKESC